MRDKKFGTFSGVFTPTILTIVGLIMYLRLGWVISQVGLKWTLIIIVCCHIVTITAALSLSSIATNIVLGHGGFYYVISRSLGLEAGGAVGIPLYISQALGAAFYLLGFTEIVVSIFPQIDPVLVKGIAFLLLLGVSILGADIAIKIQFLIMSVMIASIISFATGVFQNANMANIADFWNIKNAHSVGFWYVLAIFFPAVTGIDCGVAMSGDLKDPGKSIPKGVMSAVFVGLLFYLVITFLYVLGVEEGGFFALEDSMFMTKRAKWPWLVVCGIMGATLSSALGTILGAPRVLYALSVDRLVPFGRLLSWRTKGGEPIGAIFFSACIMSTVLFLIDLDRVAQVLTMFFIITYGAANACVFLEKLVGSPSFRPVFQVPIIVPLFGTLWCLFLMFCIDYFFATVSILCVLLVYILELRRNISREWGDVRFGLLSWIAEWSLKMAGRMPQGRRNWRPNFFVPVSNISTYQKNIEFIKDLVWPRGTVRGFLFQKNNEIIEDLAITDANVLSNEKKVDNLEVGTELKNLFDPLSSMGIYTTCSVITTKDVVPGYEVALQVLQGMSFTPNLGFFSLSESCEEDSFLSELIQLGIKSKLGMVILLANPQKRFGKKEKINVWIRSSSAPNLSLTVLIAVLLSKNWSCSVNLVSMVSEISEKSIKESSLDSIIKRGRLPRDTTTTVLIGKFPNFPQRDIPYADLNIFGTVTNEAKLSYARELWEMCNTSCLFIKDSGQESMTV